MMMRRTQITITMLRMKVFASSIIKLRKRGRLASMKDVPIKKSRGDSVLDITTYRLADEVMVRYLKDEKFTLI